MRQPDMTLVGRTGHTLTGGLITVRNVRMSPWDPGAMQLQVASATDATRPPWWIAESGVSLDPLPTPATP